MEERAKFVLEALEGWTSMTELCARYGVSRRVGYKWLARYEQTGLSGLADRSRAPRRQAAASSPEIVGEIVALRRKHPTWGPRKLRAWLDRKRPGTTWPACSTLGAILKREGLSKPRRRRPPAPQAWRPPRTDADAPNRVWTTDFKGEFRLGDGRLCYPLTILDAHRRGALETGRLVDAPGDPAGANETTPPGRQRGA
jgi:putative transposase